MSRRKRPALFGGRHFSDEIIVLCVRWYLRYPLLSRDLEEMMAERKFSGDHPTIWRRVQRDAPVLALRIKRDLKPPGGSWRVDETYVRAAGIWTYPCRAVDSAGATIDFHLSPERDAADAKQFFRKALAAANHPRPRVIDVDGNPSYPRVVGELKQERKPGRRCRCRTCVYVNNIVERDHRAVKRRINAKQGFRPFDGAWRTIQGYEVIQMIRKGRVRWSLTGDVAGQVLFIHHIFGLKAA